MVVQSMCLIIIAFGWCVHVILWLQIGECVWVVMGVLLNSRISAVPLMHLLELVVCSLCGVRTRLCVVDLELSFVSRSQDWHFSLQYLLISLCVGYSDEQILSCLRYDLRSQCHGLWMLSSCFSVVLLEFGHESFSVFSEL